MKTLEALPPGLIEKLVENAEIVQLIVELKDGLRRAEAALLNRLNGNEGGTWPDDEEEPEPMPEPRFVAVAEAEAEAEVEAPAPPAKPTKRRIRKKKRKPTRHHVRYSDEERPIHIRPDNEIEMEFRGGQWSMACRALEIGRIERRPFPNGNGGSSNRSIAWLTTDEAELARVWIREYETACKAARLAKKAALAQAKADQAAANLNNPTAPSEAVDSDTNEK